MFGIWPNEPQLVAEGLDFVVGQIQVVRAYREGESGDPNLDALAQAYPLPTPSQGPVVGHDGDEQLISRFVVWACLSDEVAGERRL